MESTQLPNIPWFSQILGVGLGADAWSHWHAGGHWRVWFDTSAWSSLDANSEWLQDWLGYGNVCSRDSVQISHSFSVFRKSNFLDRQLSQFQVQEWPLKYVVDFLFLGPFFLGLYNYNMIYFNLLYDCWILTSLNLKNAFFSTVDVIVWRPVPAACSALPWQCWMPPRRTCWILHCPCHFFKFRSLGSVGERYFHKLWCTKH